MGSATFRIDRQVTIQSNSQRHKTTMGIFTLKPTFLYFCTPSEEEAAYLQVVSAR